ncbi:MAG: 4Fe-4S binding protein [Polaromonas sp.]|nr:4Fe-4S binding protein [Polaromonas sp.]
MTHPIAQIDPARCTGCGRCIAACALRLIAFETKDWKKRSVVQNPGHCTGCGDCASRCPVNAISLAEDHQGKASPL